MQKEVSTKAIPQKIDYEYASKKSAWETIKESFPKQLIPTKKTGSIFGLILVITLIISGTDLPFDQIMSGDIDMTISIGYPLHFFEINLSDNKGSPILLTNLILNLILYIMLAYAIDVILNLIFKNPFIKSKEEIKQQPIIFENQKKKL